MSLATDNANRVHNANIVHIAESGGIEAILNAMTSNAGNLEVNEQGLGALASLAVNIANKVTIASAIPLTLKTMTAHAGHVGVNVNGCWVLANFITEKNTENSVADGNTTNQVTIDVAGAIPVILKAMARHCFHTDVNEHGLRALANHAAGNHANKLTIAAAGLIPVILKTMTVHAGHAGINKYGCGALANLARNDANKVTIAAASAIPIILKAMTAHAGDAGVNERG